MTSYFDKIIYIYIRSSGAIDLLGLSILDFLGVIQAAAGGNTSLSLIMGINSIGLFTLTGLYRGDLLNEKLCSNYT